MKITVEDEHQILTLDSKSEGLTMHSYADMVRRVALGLGYHPDCVKDELPTEFDLMDDNDRGQGRR